MKANQIAKAQIAFNVNVKNFKTKVAKNLYTITVKRLLNDFSQDKMSIQELARLANVRYTQLMTKYE